MNPVRPGSQSDRGCPLRSGHPPPIPINLPHRRHPIDLDDPHQVRLEPDRDLAAIIEAASALGPDAKAKAIVEHVERHRRLVVTEPTLLFYPRPLEHDFHNPPREGADFVCATLDFEGGAAHPLVQALPAVIVLPLRAVDGLEATLDLLFAETVRVRCGQRLLADRLFEVLVLQLLRWLVDHPEQAEVPPGLLLGLGHPRLARALTALHEHPGADWSLAAMAQVAGMSRSAFAEAFKAQRGRGAGSAGFGADFKNEITRPGQWGLFMEGYGETLPYHDNRMWITPDDTDGFGMPKIHLSMTYRENEKLMAQQMMDDAVEMMTAAKLTCERYSVLKVMTTRPRKLMAACGMNQLRLICATKRRIHGPNSTPFVSNWMLAPGVVSSIYVTATAKRSASTTSWRCRVDAGAPAPSATSGRTCSSPRAPRTSPPSPSSRSTTWPPST